ncbi:MAG: VOC family protein [Novosphingobium sp.]
MLVGRHYQNAYVTRDIAAATARFRRDAEVRTVLETEVTVELWTPAAQGKGTQKLAFIWIEDLQVELIQPGKGDVLALYRDALPDDDSVRFHHICNRVDDWDAFSARLAKQPFPVVLKGGTPGFLEFVYLDTREWLGHYLEYVWMVDERWAAMGGRER